MTNNDDHVNNSSNNGGQQTQLPCSWFVIQLTVTASLGGCLFGYDMGAISGTLPQLTQTFDLDDSQKELVVSILYIGGAIGACFGGSLCDRVGRKVTIMLTDIVFLLGALWLYFASSYTEVVVGRFVVGMGVAVSGIADVSYLHECAPIEWRGSIVSVNEACISLGFLLAYIAGYVYADEGAEEWRVVFGLAGILAAIQFVGMLKLPESPAWLIEKGNMEAARRSLELINGTTTDGINITGNEGDGEILSSDVFGSSSSHEPTFISIGRRNSRNRNDLHTDGIIIGNECASPNSPLRNDLGSGVNTAITAATCPSDGVTILNNNGEKGGIDDSVEGESSFALAQRSSNDNTCHTMASYQWCNDLGHNLQTAKLTLARYRQQVYIALFLAVAQQFCGQTNILNYAPLIFSEAMKQDLEDGDDESDDDVNAGETKDMSMVIIGLVKFFVTVLVIWRIEYIGRRFLLILGNLLIAAGLLALVVAFGGSDNNSSNNDNAAAEDDDAGDDTTSWSPLTNIKTFHLALPGVLLVVSGYSVSFGPLTWLLTSEIFPTHIRGRALGYSTIVSYMCGAISTQTFLIAQSIMGPSFVFGMYCIITIAGVLFAYLAIPDTGGKTVEQIDESLNRMYWWKYGSIALSQSDEDCVPHGGQTASPPSHSEMVRNPSQDSVHSFT